MGLNEEFIASQDTGTHRVCGECNQLLPLEEFYKDGKGSNGLIRYRRDCKTCYKEKRMKEDRLKKVKGARK